MAHGDGIQSNEVFSTAPIAISGDYIGENKNYTFTVVERGNVGVTTELEVSGKTIRAMRASSTLDSTINRVMRFLLIQDCL